MTCSAMSLSSVPSITKRQQRGQRLDENLDLVQQLGIVAVSRSRCILHLLFLLGLDGRREEPVATGAREHPSLRVSPPCVCFPGRAVPLPTLRHLRGGTAAPGRPGWQEALGSCIAGCKRLADGRPNARRALRHSDAALFRLTFPSLLASSGRYLSVQHTVIYSLPMQRKREGWYGPVVLTDDPEEWGDPARIRLGNEEFPGWIVTVRFGALGEVVGYRGRRVRLAFHRSGSHSRPRSSTKSVPALRLKGLASSPRLRHVQPRTSRRGAIRARRGGGARRHDAVGGAHLGTARQPWQGRPRLCGGRRRVRTRQSRPARVHPFGCSPVSSALASREHATSFTKRVPRLLTRTKQGRKGGRLTAKARRVLDEETGQ